MLVFRGELAGVNSKGLVQTVIDLRFGYLVFFGVAFKFGLDSHERRAAGFSAFGLHGNEYRVLYLLVLQGAYCFIYDNLQNSFVALLKLLFKGLGRLLFISINYY